MIATFDHIEELATNIKTFWFKPPHKVHYLAGQYTQLTLPHDNPDERGDKHWFTLSSSPSENMLSISTKFSNPGSSFKQTLRALKSGSKVHLADPMGDFVLPKDASIPLIFVGGGMGVTPMRSMIKWLTDTKGKYYITLLYVAANPQELIFLPLFKSYCQQVITLTRQEDGDKATLTAAKIMELTKPAKEARIYLSGPEPMIEAQVDQFAKTSINKDQLVTDYFPGYEPV